MSTKVFISYRHEDSGFAARGVHDRLERELGRESLFMDVDAIPLGLDFVAVLGAEVGKCDVLLAIIGPSWLEARDEDGDRRLDSEHDFVRIEIAAALRRNIRVIPILLEGTRVPKAERLPDDLKALARRHALDVRHTSFPADMDRLVRKLRGTTASPPKPPTENEPIAPPEPTSIGEPLTPPEIMLDDQSVPPLVPPGTSEPVAPRGPAGTGELVTIAEMSTAAEPVAPARRDSAPEAQGDRIAGGEAHRELPIKSYSPFSATGILLGVGFLVAATLVGVLFYDNGTRKPETSATSAVSSAEPVPLIAISAKPLLAEPARPLITGRQEKESVAKPGSEITDCANGCPMMVVLPSGKFIMGSPKNEPDRDDNEGPQREVTIARPFAVSKFEVTFDEWDACVTHGGCNGYPPEDKGWGRGKRPVINVSFGDAQAYVVWLSRKTGKTYRLLTEAEWEYAARGGTQTAYSWGDTIGKGNANCNGCGSQWNEQTAPVGFFEPNTFGLYDMHGNVLEWVEDTRHDNYNGGPADGSAWLQGGDASYRVVRGGSWFFSPQLLRAARRDWYTAGDRHYHLGFRVARTLTP